MKHLFYFFLGFFVVGSATFAFASPLFIKTPVSTSITYCAKNLNECEKWCSARGSLKSFQCLGDAWLDSEGIKKSACVCGDD